MAESDSTLGDRFAESEFLAKIVKPHLSDRFSINSHSCCSPLIDDHIAELMETLCLHINNVLRLPLPVQKRSRLVRNYWELEYLVKEVRLLVDPAVLSQLAEELSLSP